MLISIYFIRRGTDSKFEWSFYKQYWLIESTKTTSMEDVSTGVLEKVKNKIELICQQPAMSQWGGVQGDKPARSGVLAECSRGVLDMYMLAWKPNATSLSLSMSFSLSVSLSISLSCIQMRKISAVSTETEVLPIITPTNISNSVYLVHQSFMWFMSLNWCKSIFHPMISRCGQPLTYCDVINTWADCYPSCFVLIGSPQVDQWQADTGLPGRGKARTREGALWCSGQPTLEGGKRVGCSRVVI